MLLLALTFLLSPDLRQNHTHQTHPHYHLQDDSTGFEHPFHPSGAAHSSPAEKAALDTSAAPDGLSHPLGGDAFPEDALHAS